MKRLTQYFTLDTFFVALIGVGILVAVFAGWQRRVYERSLRIPEGVYAADALMAADPGDYDKVPAKLAVGDEIAVSVEAVPLVQDNWVISDIGASYLLESARLGERGNAILYGHNTNEILGDLVDVRVGDPVAVETTDGSQYRYEVASVQEVEPDEAALLQPTEEEVLTIYTCSGFLNSKRWVVRARPV